MPSSWPYGPDNPDQQDRADEAGNQVADPSAQDDPEVAQNGAGDDPNCICGGRRPGWFRMRREPTRLGGNITGFSSVEASIASKWLELLTGVAPDLKRAVMNMASTSFNK